MSLLTDLHIGHVSGRLTLSLRVQDQEWSADCSDKIGVFESILDRHVMVWRNVPLRNWLIGTGAVPAELIAEIIQQRATFRRKDEETDMLASVVVQETSSSRRISLTIRDMPNESTWSAEFPGAMIDLVRILSRHQVTRQSTGPAECMGSGPLPREAIVDMLLYAGLPTEQWRH